MKTTNLTLNEATSTLAAMKASFPEQEFCMAMSIGGGKRCWRVAEKTDAQKKIDQQDPELASTKVTSFISNYNVASDLH